ncbi:MAG: FHA domain-containing protein [Verrucomicrobiota bacterium]|nr:FHA domain-containing protein [Verrucomicrobiota bacterium]
MRRLIVNPGTASAWEIPLAPGVISLGRNAENNFPIEHDSVSGAHCLLTVTDSGVLIKDMGSTNGTFVNDAPADEAVLLPGQTLRLGDVLLRLESDAEPTAAIPLPAGAKADAPAAAFCKIHPRALARLHCPRCQRNFCDACVSMRQGRTFCRACGVECQPLETAPASAGPEPSFFSMARGAFAYPLQGDGVILLVGGTIFLLVIDGAKYVLRFVPGYGWVLLLLLTVFGTGYLAAYLRRILTDTAAGEKAMPDWPEFTDFSSITSPFFQLVGTVVFSFAPAIALTIYAMTAKEGGAWLGWATTACILFGCAYFPMAFTAVAMFDSIGAVNPLLIVPSILRIPLEYLFTVALFAVILLVRWLGRTFLPDILPVPVLPAVLSGLLGLYLLAVEVRVLGQLYWAKKGELGWFRR